MILRTFNCTIVNQIKSSKKTRGKIENKKSAVITDENYFQIIFRPSAVVFAWEQFSYFGNDVLSYFFKRFA